MGFRDDIDMNTLNQKQKDLINMIDEKLAEWLDDVKNGRVHSVSEVREFLRNNKKQFISNKKTSWILV